MMPSPHPNTPTRFNSYQAHYNSLINSELCYFYTPPRSPSLEKATENLIPYFGNLNVTGKVYHTGTA